MTTALKAQISQSESEKIVECYECGEGISPDDAAYEHAEYAHMAATHCNYGLGGSVVVGHHTLCEPCHEKEERKEEKRRGRSGRWQDED